jgi:hypothetical protein
VTELRLKLTDEARREERIIELLEGIGNCLGWWLPWIALWLFLIWLRGCK